MLETSFSPLLTLFSDLSETNLAFIRLPTNMLILDPSKVFCSVVKCYTTLSDRMQFLLPM